MTQINASAFATVRPQRFPPISTIAANLLNRSLTVLFAYLLTRFGVFQNIPLENWF
jgi:hypothetical protein